MRGKNWPGTEHLDRRSDAIDPDGTDNGLQPDRLAEGRIEILLTNL